MSLFNNSTPSPLKLQKNNLDQTSPTKNEGKDIKSRSKNVGDLCATAAREMGKDLFIAMEPAAREKRLNDMVHNVAIFDIQLIICIQNIYINIC